MDEIIVKTYELIDCISDSDIVKDISMYKNRLMNNKKIIDLVNRYNSSEYDYEKLSIKKELYSNSDYSRYMECYNKLYDIVRKINYKYKMLLNNKRCK